MKKTPDIVDLNEWLTIEEAVTASVNAGVSRTGAHFYKLAKDGDLLSRSIKTKLCLARQAVEQYLQKIRQKAKPSRKSIRKEVTTV